MPEKINPSKEEIAKCIRYLEEIYPKCTALKGKKPIGETECLAEQIGITKQVNMEYTCIVLSKEKPNIWQTSQETKFETKPIEKPEAKTPEAPPELPESKAGEIAGTGLKKIVCVKSYINQLIADGHYKDARKTINQCLAPVYCGKTTKEIKEDKCKDIEKGKGLEGYRAFMKQCAPRIKEFKEDCKKKEKVVRGRIKNGE